MSADGRPPVQTNLPVAWNPSDLAHLKYACLLPNTQQYSTQLNLFPGNNAHPPWGTQGLFCLTITLYDCGKEVGKIHSKAVSERGNIRLNFDRLTDFFETPKEGICIVDLHSARDIPVELYLSHVHRETGVYVAYPALGFVGDQLYPATHAHQLENTLFWPGLVENQSVEACITVLNPYTAPMGFQIHLFRADGSRQQTPVLRLKPFERGIYSVDEIFPEAVSRFGSDGQSSLCVAAQYKVVAYMILKDRDSGTITTIDHLHAYCLH